MIISLSLTNWLSHKSTKLDFMPKMNLLYGRNGAGKSSILNAIYYCLLGESVIEKGKLTQYIRQGSREAKLKIVFSSILNPENIYEVNRFIRYKGTTSAKLSIFNNKKKVIEELEGVKKVNNRISEILNFNPIIKDIFFLFKEGELGDYLSSTPSIRKKPFYELFNLKKVEEIRRAFLFKINKEKDNRKHILLEYKQNKQRLEEIKHFNIESLLSQETFILKKLKNLYKLREKIRFDEADREVISISEKLRIIDIELENLKEIRNQEEKMERSILGKISSFDELSRIAHSSADIKESIKSLRRNYEENMSKRMNNLSKLDSLKTRIKTLQLDQPHEEKICPTCKRELSSDLRLKIVKETNIEIRSLEKKREIQANKIKRIGKLIEAKNKDLEESIKSEGKFNQLKSILIKKKETNYKIISIEADCEELRNKLDYLTRKRQNKLDSPLITEKEIHKDQEDLRKITGEIKEGKRSQEEIFFLENQIARFEEEIKTSEKNISLLNPAHLACKTILDRYLVNLIDEISGTIKDYMKQMLNLSVIRVRFDSRNFLLSVDLKEGERSFRYFSGGEKAITYLSYKLSLVKHFSEEKFALFDEPTEHLDSLNSAIIRENLFELLNDDSFPLDQIIVAASDPRFSGPISKDYNFKWNKIYLIEKPEKDSIVTEIKKEFLLKSPDTLLKEISLELYGNRRIPPELAEKITRISIDSDLYNEKLLSGSNTDILFRKKLKELKISFFEMKGKEMDLMIRLNEKKYAIEIRSTKKELKSYKIDYNSIEQVIEEVNDLNLDGVVIAIYFFNIGRWMIVKLDHIDKLDKKLFPISKRDLIPIQDILKWYMN